MNQEEAIEVARALPWAKWVAQDDDGSWWAYDAEPALERGTWHAGPKAELLVLLPGPKVEVTR